MTKQEMQLALAKRMEKLAQEYGYKWKYPAQCYFLTKNDALNKFEVGGMTYNYPPLLILNGFQHSITYKPLGKIVGTLIKKHKLSCCRDELIFTLFDPKHQLPFRSDISPVDYSRYEVRTYEDLEPALSLFEQYFLECALPFFEKYATLPQYLAYLDSIEGQNKDNFFHQSMLGIHNPDDRDFYLLALYRLCNDARYKDFLQIAEERQKKYALKLNGVFQGPYAVFLELKSVLEKTKPLYNI